MWVSEFLVRSLEAWGLGIKVWGWGLSFTGVWGSGLEHHWLDTLQSRVPSRVYPRLLTLFGAPSTCPRMFCRQNKPVVGISVASGANDFTHLGLSKIHHQACPEGGC